MIVSPVYTGTDARTGNTFFAGENIYGPFENGFGQQQVMVPN